jgi:hypothetical protein
LGKDFTQMSKNEEGAYFLPTPQRVHVPLPAFMLSRPPRLADDTAADSQELEKKMNEEFLSNVITGVFGLVVLSDFLLCRLLLDGVILVFSLVMEFAIHVAVTNTDSWAWVTRRTSRRTRGPITINHLSHLCFPHHFLLQHLSAP